MFKWFSVKQRIELHIDTDKGILNLSTHIEHITSEGEIIVAAPFYKGQLYPFLAREHVELFTIVESVGIISCDVIVAKRLKNGNIALLLLERISDIRKTQRRRHYRLPTLLDAELETTDRTDFQMFHAVTRDISAGGVRCITPEKLFEKEHVKLKVDLNGEVLNLHSSVLESVSLKADQMRFETRFMFDDLGMEDERVIVAYIFDEQRKRRRRI
ncbi:MAG: flagellar brake protein [Clostridia bacterium]|nr:flagellar brake protein [Clostridia bacterium]